MDMTIAITHPSLGDLLDPLHQNSLPGPVRAVVVGRSVDRQRLTRAPDADLPNRPNLINHLSLPGRLHIFRRITSCSISLSSDRSATSFFSRWFTPSSCFSRFISDGTRPAILFAPAVERRLADPCLAADLGDRRALLRLPHHKRNLLLADPRLLPP